MHAQGGTRMPWRETCPVDERLKFIAAYLRGEISLSRLCAAFSVSRKTGYKWIERYTTDGAGALLDRTRRPHSHPTAVPEEVAELVVGARRCHPFWGPKKLLLSLATTDRTPSGAPTSRGTSGWAVDATCTRSPSRTASAGFSSGARACCGPPHASCSPSSSRPSASTDSLMPSARTTDHPSPPVHRPGFPTWPSGGSSSASVPSESNQVGRSRTEDMSGCIGR